MTVRRYLVPPGDAPCCQQNAHLPIMISRGTKYQGHSCEGVLFRYVAPVSAGHSLSLNLCNSLLGYVVHFTALTCTFSGLQHSQTFTTPEPHLSLNEHTAFTICRNVCSTIFFVKKRSIMTECTREEGKCALQMISTSLCRVFRGEGLKRKPGLRFSKAAA